MRLRQTLIWRRCVPMISRACIHAPNAALHLQMQEKNQSMCWSWWPADEMFHRCSMGASFRLICSTPGAALFPRIPCIVSGSISEIGWKEQTALYLVQLASGVCKGSRPHQSSVLQGAGMLLSSCLPNSSQCPFPVSGISNPFGPTAFKVTRSSCVCVSRFLPVFSQCVLEKCEPFSTSRNFPLARWINGWVPRFIQVVGRGPKRSFPWPWAGRLSRLSIQPVRCTIDVAPVLYLDIHCRGWKSAIPLIAFRGRRDAVVDTRLVPNARCFCLKKNRK